MHKREKVPALRELSVLIRVEEPEINRQTREVQMVKSAIKENKTRGCDRQ